MDEVLVGSWISLDKKESLSGRVRTVAECIINGMGLFYGFWGFFSFWEGVLGGSSPMWLWLIDVQMFSSVDRIRSSVSRAVERAIECLVIFWDRRHTTGT